MFVDDSKLVPVKFAKLAVVGNIGNFCWFKKCVLKSYSSKLIK